jgi:dsRNA-specific ribonuclease
MKQFIALLLFLGASLEIGQAGKPNKESYTLIRENFSETESINFEELQKHLGYQFNDQTLLQEALYPLLPKTLKKGEEKYNHLEFLGDSVLGTTIREYLVKTFPAQERSFLVAAYELLTRNKTLTEVYLKQLSIEEYLPFPENKKCEYCNVIEALIGAIHLDGKEKGYRNAQKFVMTILNDHVIQEKISIIASERSITLGVNLWPEIKKHLEEVSQDQTIERINPKSFLGEVLLKTWSGAPQYTLFLTINTHGNPLIEARVSGIQIGREQIKGVGYTTKEAEENAARNAINFISQQPTFPVTEPVFRKTYAALLKEWGAIKKITGLQIEESTFLSPTIFKYQVILKDGILIAGEGPSKKSANEEACKQAYHHLANSESSGNRGLKNYRTLLKEWFDKNSDSIFEFEEHLLQADPLYTIQILIDQEVVSKKNGVERNDIKEAACRDALIYLVEQQDTREKDIESRRLAGKPAEKTMPDSKTFIKTDSSIAQSSKRSKKNAFKPKNKSQSSTMPQTEKVPNPKKKQTNKESSVVKKASVPSTEKGEKKKGKRK